MQLIETKELAQKQGSKYLLNDVNWTVQEGEHWVVFGTNGCGKTTLLSTVAGYRNYHYGDVSLFGERLTRENAVLLRQQVGFVSSSYFDRCFHGESGFDIVLSAAFGGLGRRANVTDDMVKRAIHLLDSFGMHEKSSYPYYMMSQGQRQKILLCRALMTSPKLLLLDEPVNGLDQISRSFFLNTLKEIVNETKASIVYVTHHTEEILPFYNKALLLKNGSVYNQGDIHDMFSNEVMTGFFNHDTTASWHDGQVYLEIGREVCMPKAYWE